MLPGNIKALKDIWIVGDDFANDIVPTLASLRQEDRDHKRKSPYMFDYYNVDSITNKHDSFLRNVMANMLNGVIRGLNEKVKLPRIILFIPDADLLKHFDHFTFGITLISGKCTNWMLNNIERALDARKDEIRRRRPGALSPSEPKCIWIKMINRVNGQSELLSMRTKFNNVLEEQLANRHHHYIIDINEVMAKSSNFTPNNFLSAIGKEVYWREVDKIIELFDAQKLSLRPNPQSLPTFDEGAICSKYNRNEKLKMPPPPPMRRSEESDFLTSKQVHTVRTKNYHYQR